MAVEITWHNPPEAPSDIVVRAVDEPEYGAHHYYQIHWGANVMVYVPFQKGPVAEVGHNGITNEALLAIVQHRLECFQMGPFNCPQNDEALTAVEEALEALHQRTKDRRERGVEGKYQV